MLLPRDNQEEINELYVTLSRTISPERLGAYLTAAGFDHARALNLYIWNARMCGAFYLPLQATEVGLRNGVNSALGAVYGGEWWQRNNPFWTIANYGARGSLNKVFDRLRAKRLPLNTAQVVAGLSFGFWVNMLDSNYNQHIWSQQLTMQFPNIPDGTTREQLKSRAAQTANFRNRVSHHEPIYKLNVSGEYAKLMQLLSWICPSKKDWIRDHCEVPKIMRQKP